MTVNKFMGHSDPRCRLLDQISQVKHSDQPQHHSGSTFTFLQLACKVSASFNASLTSRCISNQPRPRELFIYLPQLSFILPSIVIRCAQSHIILPVTMEPRARAGKNVGKMNFSHNERTFLNGHLHGLKQPLLTSVPVAQLLYAHGDVKNPLPETVRVLDEILTDFMQSIAFEASRAAHYTGRQKIKYEDFEFAFRKNPAFLGKVQEVFEKQKEIKKAREILRDNEEDIIKDAADEEKKKDKTDTQKLSKAEEELGEADDDDEAEADALGKKK